MDTNARKIRIPFKRPPLNIAALQDFINLRKLLYRLITLAVVLGIWQLTANHCNSELLLPTPLKTASALWFAVSDVEILQNLLLTLKRVIFGLGIAMSIGITLGFLMGYSQTALELIDPFIGPVRQVPIMAWVPLTIVWFGLGDGPTLFLIAMVGIFPILLNTVAAVHGIPKDYYNAARSMGAGSWSIFRNIIVPASLPEILTGMRIAVSAGWMSVI